MLTDHFRDPPTHVPFRHTFQTLYASHELITQAFLEGEWGWGGS